MVVKINDLDQVLQRAREVYGNKNQIMVVIEELNELSCVLAKYPRYDNHDIAVEKTYERVCDEFADVLIVLEHVKAIYNLKDHDIAVNIDKKTRRLERWLDSSDHFQYTTESREV